MAKTNATGGVPQTYRWDPITLITPIDTSGNTPAATVQSPGQQPMYPAGGYASGGGPYGPAASEPNPQAAPAGMLSPPYDSPPPVETPDWSSSLFAITLTPRKAGPTAQETITPYVDRRADTVTPNVTWPSYTPTTISQEPMMRPTSYDPNLAGFTTYENTVEPAVGATTVTAGGKVVATPSDSTKAEQRRRVAEAADLESELTATKADLADLEKQQKSDQTKQGIATAAQGVSSSVGNIWNELLQTNQNYAQVNYYNKKAEWQANGTSYFDPNADLRPDLNKYLDEMPTRTEQLEEGTITKGWTGTNVKEDTGGGWWGWVMNPAGGVVEAAAGDEWQGAADYTWNTAVGRCLEYGSKTNSAYGYLAGAVVGIVEGIFNWNSAIKQDKADAKKARDTYLKKLQEWQFKRNQRVQAAIVAGKEQARQYNLAKAEKRRAAKKEATIENRNRFIGAINSAMQNQQGNFQRSLSMWG